MYWRNSDFQLAHFLEAYTPDEKYRVLKQQLRERQKALALAKAAEIKRQMEMDRLRALSGGRHEVAAKEALSALLTLEAEGLELEDCVAACEHEIKTIERLIDEVQPFRKYAHLSDPEAHQACQEDEWAAKLAARARTMLASQGFIAWDHLQTMMSHPQWGTKILPAIQSTERGILQMKRPDLPALSWRPDHVRNEDDSPGPEPA